MSRKILTFLAAFLGASIAAALVASHQNSVSVASNPAPSVTTSATGQRLYSYSMPASSAPTHCTVWMQGHDATILFSSDSLDVNPACDSWVTSSAASGELWIKNEVASSDIGIVCSLRDGAAVAEIEDDQGAVFGQQACTELIAGGWTEQDSSPVQ